jgi:hypothetical protein
MARRRRPYFQEYVEIFLNLTEQQVAAVRFQTAGFNLEFALFKQSEVTQAVPVLRSHVPSLTHDGCSRVFFHVICQLLALPALYGHPWLIPPRSLQQPLSGQSPRYLTFLFFYQSAQTAVSIIVHTEKGQGL